MQSPVEYLMPRFRAAVNGCGAVLISTFFNAVDPVFYCLTKLPILKTLGLISQGPLQNLVDVDDESSIHPMLRVMYTVSATGHCIFNELKSDLAEEKGRTAFLGRLTKLSQLETLQGLKYDVIALDAAATMSPEVLSEAVQKFLPEYKLTFSRRYSARELGCPTSDGGYIFCLSCRPPNQANVDKLIEFMSRAQVDTGVKFEHYVESDIQWYFGKAECEHAADGLTTDPMELLESGGGPEEQKQGQTIALAFHVYHFLKLQVLFHLPCSGETDEQDKAKKLSFEELVAKACQHRWLPQEDYKPSKKRQSEVSMLPCKRHQAELLQVHAAILHEHYKQRHSSDVLTCDASSQRLSHHQVYSGEFPPFGGKSKMVLTYNPKGLSRYRILSSHELLQTRGYDLGTVHTQLLGSAASANAAANAVPSAVGLILCAVAKLMQPE